jgi:transposase
MVEAEVATDKKGGRRKLASIALLDETGFMLQPLRHRTWSPRGQTPIQKPWDRRDRLSAIGALTVSPRRRHLNLYFRIQPRNVEGSDLVDFVEQLHRCVRGPLIVVWDRLGAHRQAAAQLLREHSDWLSIEWLPSYSPKLNPIEHCWDQIKYHDLANFLPDNIDELHEAASGSLSQQHLDQSLLRSHFKYAQLAL